MSSESISMSRGSAAQAGDRRFTTVRGPVSGQIEVKRSRFLCDLVPLGSADDDRSGAADVDERAEARARAAVEAARKQHWDARHHCSAFVIGPSGQTRRSSDDGEPSGTAGAPMLDVLVGAGLTDVVAVVTRWFGGTLLGAGGLVRAYGDAVREAAAGAELVTYVERLLVDTDVEVAQVGRVENALRAAGVGVEGVDYLSRAEVGRVVMRLAVGAPDLERTGGIVAEVTGAAAELVASGETWVPLTG